MAKGIFISAIPVLKMELVMKTASGVELFYNSTTNTYISEDMDAVIKAIVADMNSNNIMDAFFATMLFEKMQNATLISE